MSVKIRMRCNATSQGEFWRENQNGQKPVITTAALAVVDTKDPDDPNYAYSELSPGSYLNISTINPEAGKEFVMHGEYEIIITRLDTPALTN
jgi:hypothetical protein